MKAFVEHLSGIVRIGDVADHYGAPFEVSVAYASVDGKTAVIKALTSDGNLRVSHARAVIRALKDLGLRAIWERIR